MLKTKANGPIAVEGAKGEITDIEVRTAVNRKKQLK